MKTVRQAVLTVVALTLVGALTSSEPLAAPPKGKTVAEKAPTGVASSRDASAVAANLDRLIDERLAAAKVKASPLTDDGEFIRRLSLDLRGRVPTAERVAAFLADTAPDKRARLIDEFLADPEYGEHFAIIWYHRIVKPDDDNRHLVGGNKFQDWLAERFNTNAGWDKIVTDMLTVSGNRDNHPETMFWLSNVGDAKAGQPEPNKITGAASKLFLGVRLECCECHNHPFSTLKQTDFWSTAAFFAQTHAENSSKKDAKNDKTPVVHEGGMHKERKKDADHKPQPFGSIEIPYAKGKVVKASFLGGEAPNLAGQTALRPVFSNWLTSAKNPFFSRAAANKMWANFFGRGIVEPVDDMRVENEKKATHPELLSMLADEFAAANFDLKYLIRCICLSKTYQRTSKPLPENKDDDTLFSRVPLKVMSADMLYDSLNVVLGHRVADREEKGGKNKKKGYGGPREQFRKLFHAEADDDSGVVEDYTHGIPQVLKLLNSKQVNDTSAAVAKVMQGGGSQEKIIEGLYLTALARRPTDAEVKRIQKFLAGEKDSAKGYGDVLWALINTNEFLFNH
jgi:hypothetical protein